MVSVLLGQKQPHEMPLSPYDVVSLALDPGAVVFLASQMARQHLAHRALLSDDEGLLTRGCLHGRCSPLPFKKPGVVGHALVAQGECEPGAQLLEICSTKG